MYLLVVRYLQQIEYYFMRFHILQQSLLMGTVLVLLLRLAQL
jgi:hypothetical protein